MIQRLGIPFLGDAPLRLIQLAFPFPGQGNPAVFPVRDRSCRNDFVRSRLGCIFRPKMLVGFFSLGTYQGSPQRAKNKK